MSFQSFSRFRREALGEALKSVGPPPVGSKSFSEELLKAALQEAFKPGMPKGVRLNRDIEQD